MAREGSARVNRRGQRVCGGGAGVYTGSDQALGGRRGGGLCEERKGGAGASLMVF